LKNKTKFYTKTDFVKEVYRYFVGPYVLYMKNLFREPISAEVCIDSFFHASSRELQVTKASRSFKMPGLQVKNANLPISGLTNNEVEKDSIVFIAIDHAMDRVAIEIVEGPNPWAETSIKYQLTKTQFESIKGNLRWTELFQ